MDNIRGMFGNYVLTIAFASWFAAQIIKTILHMITNNKFEAERLLGAGGMPSAHSALVCSMTLAMARKVGPASPEFALAFLFASVVLYDAMGVRRAAGEHARLINRFILTSAPKEGDGNGQMEEAKERPRLKPVRYYRRKKDIEGKKLKEYLGHTPLEVLCGALLGILITMLMPVW